ncbi:MAG: type II toxin-antitoxin system RelE/ParE family toxin [Acetatifactor sp.]|nr:type II toxin-antitoxin system RelE/ParE family toxin [Acetatifactor sp.]
MKNYILDQFKYRELGENFTQKMKKATNGLKTLPGGHNTIGFSYRGYDIHLKPYLTYLFFCIVNEEDSAVTILRVLQDKMNWQFIMKQWLAQNK